VASSRWTRTRRRNTHPRCLAGSDLGIAIGCRQTCVSGQSADDAHVFRRAHCRA
jgi:hypothetical protein